MLRLSALLAVVLSTAAQSAQSERLDLGGGVTLDILKIPAGSFEMGSPTAEVGRGPDEELHRVTISEDFWLGRTPVTRGQFARFVQDSGYRTEAEKGSSGGFGFDGTGLVQRKDFTWRNPGFAQTDDHPVVIVTYADAHAFVSWLSRTSGRQVTLPSEAQWEYACRAGTTSRFYSGEGDLDAERIAWFKKNAGSGTHPVGEKEANAFGLHDMCGNVYQWCRDTYAAYVSGGGEQGPMDKPRNVLRGGSWIKDAKHVRSAARARNTPGSRNADNGFRIVVSTKAMVVTPAPARTTPVEAPPPPVRDQPRPAPVEEPPPVRDADVSIVRNSGPGCFLPVFIIVFGVAAVFIIFVVLAMRRGAASRQPIMQGPVLQRPQPPLRAVAPRLADDGFWFDTSGYSAGDLVTYTYTGRNGTVTEQFLVDPGAGQQFVYTGIRPSDIVLGNLIARQLEQQAPPLPPSRPSPIRRSDDDDRPRRYPPAY
jgi:formylglycine-generating enzyme required for sulfatase activity